MMPYTREQSCIESHTFAILRNTYKNYHIKDNPIVQYFLTDNKRHELFLSDSAGLRHDLNQLVTLIQSVNKRPIDLSDKIIIEKPENPHSLFMSPIELASLYGTADMIEYLFNLHQTSVKDGKTIYEYVYDTDDLDRLLYRVIEIGSLEGLETIIKLYRLYEHRNPASPIPHTLSVFGHANWNPLTQIKLKYAQIASEQENDCGRKICDVLKKMTSLIIALMADSKEALWSSSATKPGTRDAARKLRTHSMPEQYFHVTILSVTPCERSRHDLPERNNAKSSLKRNKKEVACGPSQKPNIRM